MKQLVEYISMTMIGMILAVAVGQVVVSVWTQALAPITAALGNLPQ
jgi:Tfp pilus assembly protein PilW